MISGEAECVFVLLINAFKSTGNSGSNPIRTNKYAEFVFVRLLLLLLLGARGGADD